MIAIGGGGYVPDRILRSVRPINRYPTLSLSTLFCGSVQLMPLLQILPQAPLSAQYPHPSHRALPLRIAPYHEQERPGRNPRHKSHPYAMA